MANIKNTEGLSTIQLADYIKQGGKFVIFQYTVSIVVMTFKRNSSVYFIKPGEGTFKYAWPHTCLNIIMGWWGIPWGPIYTIGCLVTNLGGGKDFTSEFANQLGLNNHSGYNIPGSNSSSNSSQSGSGYNIPGSNSNSNSGEYNIPGNNNNNQSGGYNIPR
jgi:hypothetical protein